MQKRSTAIQGLGDNEIIEIYNVAKCFEIIPSDYVGKYDEMKISQIAPKLKNKSMKQIIKLTGMEWVKIHDYCEINVVSTHVQETSIIRITYQLFESVFKHIPVLNIISNDGKNVDLSYYSYKTILEKSGIKLEDSLPYLKTEKVALDRKDIFGNEIIISKNDLANYAENPSLIKIHKNNGPEGEFILTNLQEFEEKNNNFLYIRQKEIIKGKNKNDEPVEEEWLMMDLECDELLPGIDEVIKNIDLDSGKIIVHLIKGL